jgi:hypothetical protein
MEVYLHCEGQNDYAVIYPLMVKFIDREKLSLKWIKRNELKNWVTHRKKKFSISGSHKLLTALAAIALTKNCKNIAYHQDADGEYDDVYKTIKIEFERLPKSEFNCLAIVPKEMIEAWVMADKNVYPNDPKNPPLPPKPEELWGAKESESHPKKYIEKVLEQFHLTPCSEVFSEIVEKSSIEVLKTRCPESFGQFYADMQIFLPDIQYPSGYLSNTVPDRLSAAGRRRSGGSGDIPGPGGGNTPGRTGCSGGGC